MRAALLVVLSLALLSCVEPGERVAQQREVLEFPLRIVPLPKAQLVAQCVKLGAWPADTAEKASKRRDLGCASFNLDTHTCTVYVPLSTTVDDQATTVLGHEVMHCAYGRYHS